MEPRRNPGLHSNLGVDRIGLGLGFSPPIWTCCRIYARRSELMAALQKLLLAALLVSRRHPV